MKVLKYHLWSQKHFFDLGFNLVPPGEGFTLTAGCTPMIHHYNLAFMCSNCGKLWALLSLWQPHCTRPQGSVETDYVLHNRLHLKKMCNYIIFTLLRNTCWCFGLSLKYTNFHILDAFCGGFFCLFIYNNDRRWTFWVNAAFVLQNQNLPC